MPQSLKTFWLAFGLALILWATGLPGHASDGQFLPDRGGDGPPVGAWTEVDWGEPYPLDFAEDRDVRAATYQPSTADGPDLQGPGASAEFLLPAPASEGQLEQGPIISLMPESGQGDGPLGPYLPSDHILGYNPTGGGLTWIPASGDDFGWFSWEHGASLSGQRTAGFVAGMNFHFLNGPVRAEMPPRLFDFIAGYQRREWIRPHFGWDIALRIGVFSDFEGSADEGMRFPSHLVTFWRLTPTLTVLGGIDYLDWDEIKLLPVFGFTWIPTEDYRFDIAFPRPRAAVRIMESDTWVAIGGELAGGTWAIEREHRYDDNVTYSDMRIYLALETFLDSRISSSIEIGYVFQRDLEYRSGVGNYYPEDAMMIRWTGRR